MSAGSIPCESTNAAVTVAFNGVITAASVEGGTASFAGNEAIFDVPNLEATPTSFTVVLDTCAELDGEQVVAAASYADDEANVPDLSLLLSTGVVTNGFCDDGVWGLDCRTINANRSIDVI